MKLLNRTICFLVLISIVGCQENPQDKKSTHVRSIEKELPFDQSKEVYDIINCTLKHLIPKSNLSHPTVLVHHQLLVADTELINEFTAKGGSKLLNALNHEIIQPMPISIRKIDNFKNVQLLETYPLTSDEIDRNIGGAIFSRIILNKSRDEAAFIFDFSHLHEKKGRVFCAVQVIKTNNKWNIVKKIDLKNSNKMLIE